MALKSSQAAGQERMALLENIGEKLVKYDEILMKVRDLNGFQRPSDRDYASLRNWYHRKNPLIAREGAYIKLREDLVTLRQGREWAGFDGWIESTINRLPFGIKVSIIMSLSVKILQLTGCRICSPRKS